MYGVSNDDKRTRRNIVRKSDRKFLIAQYYKKRFNLKNIIIVVYAWYLIVIII